MKAFLPYRGEFGFICMMHAPQVHACHESKIVVCEAGNEAMYPGAERYIHCDRRDDDARRARVESDLIEHWERRLRFELGDSVDLVPPNTHAPREYFVPRPASLVELGAEPDIVVCPRLRTYGADKNWPHWPDLVRALRFNGHRVFAAGVREASDHRVQCEAAWHHERPLDATIAAMHAARLVIATDAGLAHLAVLCGRPLIMISHGDGLVAPGHDDVGRPYWPIMLDRYRQENHTGSPIHVVHHAWDSTEPTLQAVEGVISCA